MKVPNLAGVVTPDLVDHIGAGKFSAAYINWSRTVNLLRQHAPGWLPELVLAPDGGILHRAPVGAYLMVCFRNGEDVTPPVPHAVMDTRNAAIPFDKITARDVTDTHRRGVCLAAAFTFGLAYELWAKLPMEQGGNSAPVPDELDASIVDAMCVAAAAGKDALAKAFAEQEKTASFSAWWKENGPKLKAASAKVGGGDAAT